MARKRMADVMEMDEEEVLEAHNEAFGDETDEEMVEAEEGEEIEGEDEDAEEVDAPPRKVYKSTERLRVDLTNEEILKAGKEMAQSIDELNDLEKERKAAADTYKARIAQATANVQINSNLVRNGYEFRKVDVERTFDYEEGIVSAIRLDTGEVFESRAMTRDERQMTCF